MRNPWRMTVLLFCSLGLVAVGAACDESGDCNGALRYGDTVDLAEGEDELVATVESIDFTLDGGEDLTFEIPCEDVDEIISRDVAVRSLTTGNFVEVEEEFFDNGDGICGFNYLPMGHDGSGWLGEPQACDRYLAEAQIDVEAYRITDALNSKVATIDQTRTLTASTEFFTACPHSVEMPDALGIWRWIAVGSDEAVSRLYLTSDVEFDEFSYMKLFTGFDGTKMHLPEVFVRPSMFGSKIRSIALREDERAGVLTDLTLVADGCDVNAYDLVTSARLWTKTLADQCLGADTSDSHLVVLGRTPGDLNVFTTLDILTGMETGRTEIDPTAYGYDRFGALELSSDGAYLVLARDAGGSVYVLKANHDLPVFDVIASDTDFTLIRGFVSDAVTGFIYTYEDVFKEGDVVATVFKRDMLGSVHGKAEIKGAGLEIRRVVVVGDYAYAIANSDDDGYAAIAKIDKANMDVVWVRYAIARFRDVAVDKIRGDVFMMGEKLGGRVEIPTLFRLSVFGHFYGDDLIEGLDEVMDAIGDGEVIIIEDCEGDACLLPLMDG